MREQMNILLSSTNPNIQEELKSLGIEENETNNQMGLMVGLYKSAIKGNVQAFEKIQELDKDNEQEFKYNVSIPSKIMPPAFINIYRSILNREYREFWLEGGRASLKSTFVNEVVIDLLENNPKMCAIIIRRYTNTLKDSVYSQTEWTVSKFSETFFNFNEDYKFKSSPLEVTKISTGQKIYFRGTDDPRKNKIN